MSAAVTAALFTVSGIVNYGRTVHCGARLDCSQIKLLQKNYKVDLTRLQNSHEG
jgi:hypothetical protein